MPRQPRLDRPGLVHHVMARGIEGQVIYRDDQDKEAFLQRLADGFGRPGRVFKILCQRHRLRYFSSRPGKWIVSCASVRFQF